MSDLKKVIIGIACITGAMIIDIILQNVFNFAISDVTLGVSLAILAGSIYEAMTKVTDRNLAHE